MTINDVLKAHNVPQQIALTDLTITDNTLSDLVKPEQRLTNAVIDAIWPSIREMEVSHFTSRSAAEEILRSGVFRLTNIEKRYSELEIRSFCENHKLDGYMQRTPNGEPLYKELIMPNTFYAAFTERFMLPDEEQRLWDAFAMPDGVRLQIKIKATNTNFRKIVYEAIPGQAIPLLKGLQDAVAKNGQLRFVLGGISRVCSFYLPRKYACEMEYRILHRLWGEDQLQDVKRNSDGIGYIEIPLGSPGKWGYQLEIVQVCSSKPLSVPSSYPFMERAPTYTEI